MEKRRFSLVSAIVLSLILALTMMPMSAAAAGTSSDVSIYVSYQADDSGFVIANQKVNVHPGLAKEYGYTYASNVKSTDITALDALVAAHILYYDGDKTAIQTDLKVSSAGGVTSYFGNNDWNFMFFVNGEQTHAVAGDATANYGYESYTGDTINQSIIKAGDSTLFYKVQDSYYLDNVVWFERDGVKTEKLIAIAGENIDLVARGYCNWYALAVPATRNAMTKNIEDTALVPVDIDTSGGWNVGIFDSPITVSGDDGKISFNAPNTTGTYYYGAIDDSGYEPMISPWLEVSVVDAAVKDVINQIAALPNSVTLANETAVASAKATYDALTNAQKAQLSSASAATVTKLDTAVKEIDTLAKARDILKRTHTVSFNANGGKISGSASKSVLENESYGTLATASRTGYTFTGWHTESTGGSKVTEGTAVTSKTDHTLHAHWTANKYTVKFNANGGKTKKSSKKVTFDSAYGTLPAPAKDLKDFKGWYTAKSGGKKVKSSTVVSTAKNTTLYAHWANAQMKVVNCKTVWVKKGPGVSYKSITTLKKGTKVEILSKANGWYKIKCAKTTGWVYGDYIG